MRDRLLALLRRRRRFLTFCAVGGSGVVVNMAVYLLALGVVEDLGARGLLAVNLAAVAGWIVSVSSNFALNDRLTFRHAEGSYESGGLQRLTRYYASASVAFVIQAAVLNGLLLALDSALVAKQVAATQAGLEALGLPVGVALRWRRTSANLIGIGVATVANYLLARNWVFRKAIVPDAGMGTDVGAGAGAADTSGPRGG